MDTDVVESLTARPQAWRRATCPKPSLFPALLPALVPALVPALLPALTRFSSFLFNPFAVAKPAAEENLENRYWDFGGSTVVSTNKYVRLTPDRQSKTGWLWSKQVREPRARSQAA